MFGHVPALKYNQPLLLLGLTLRNTMETRSEAGFLPKITESQLEAKTTENMQLLERNSYHEILQLLIPFL